MEIWKAAVLGIVQGLTEFLPVSSSGHILLFERLLGVSTGGADMFLGIVLHAGTLVAVIADYNAACESGVDAMGKDAQYLHPITGENLYAFKCINYTYGTDGGLDVDLDLNVLRTDGSKIEGLYATGYDCSGVLYNSNKSYVDYGGSALGWAFTSGRLAGENAVRYIAE